jgi:hypothetical protein
VILDALRAKLRDRGPLGFARDAAELAASCYVVAVWQVALGAAAIGAGVVAAPFIAWDLLVRRGRR